MRVRDHGKTDARCSSRRSLADCTCALLADRKRRAHQPIQPHVVDQAGGRPGAPSTAFYAGKKLCYVYKAKTKKQGRNYRTIWGKEHVRGAAAFGGVVRLKFKSHLPSNSIGGKVRCMLYPSNI